MFIRNRVSWSLAMLALMSTGGLLQGCKSDGNGNGKVDGGVASIDVFPGQVQTTEQAGASQSGTFSVVLRTAPTADVTIPVSSSDTSEGTVSVASLTFTPSNWATPQPVTVTGVEDEEADGDITYTVITAPATSTDVLYAGVNPADVTVKNIDNDSAGIRTAMTAGLTTTEAGGMAKFTIVLNTKPTADVIVPISSSATGEVTVVNPTVTFTPTNWNAPIEVTVKGVEDEAADGNVEVTISTAGATSTDTRYAGVKFADVKVTNIDNDSAGFVIEPTTELVTGEDGTTDTFTVKLTTKPTADVVLPISSGTPTEVSVDKTSLTFTVANWASPQTVTVTGVNDDAQDGPKEFSIATAPAMSADGRYDGRNPSDVTGINQDNDTPGFSYTDADDVVTRENGQSHTFYVRLNTRPLTTVTIPVSTNPATEATATPATLEFTIDNWASPHPVLVTGANDDVQDGNQQFLVVLGAAAGDEAYAGMDPPDVMGTNEDDDSPGVLITKPATLETSETGSTATFTVQLQTKPTGNVTVPVVSGTTTEIAATPANLVFTPTNYGPQTVTLTGQNDDEADGPAPVVITVGPSSSDSADAADPYKTVAAQIVNATNNDNDTADLAVVFDGPRRTTAESGPNRDLHFFVYLRSAPTANVKFNFAVSNANEAEMLTAFVEFTSTDWSSPKLVSVRGKDDSVKDGPIPYTVSIVADPTNYAGYLLPTRTIPLTNNDDDQPDIMVTETLVGNNVTMVTTEAGGTATFRVSLASQPQNNETVFIPVTSSNTAEGTVPVAEIAIPAAAWGGVDVIITGAPDDIADGPQSYRINFGPTRSGDEDYDNIQLAGLDVVNTDNDTAGLTLSGPSTLDTFETGGTPRVINVKLNTQPTADVTVTAVVIVDGEDPQDEISVVPASRTFNASNWSGDQSFTITGIPDSTQDGNKPFKVRFVPSNTGTYSAALAQERNGINEDYESPGIRVEVLNDTSTELGGTAVFAVTLHPEPTGTVTLPLRVLSTALPTRTEGAITDPVFTYMGEPALVFTPADYASPHPVVVQGQDDLLEDDDTEYEVEVGPAVSSDTRYGGKYLRPNVTLINTDNDTADIQINLASSAASRRDITENTSLGFDFVLTTEPRANVVVNFAPSNVQGATNVPSLTFTPGNWATPQTVNVQAVNDAIADGNVPFEINVTVTAGVNDTAYSALTKTIYARAMDNDSAGVTLTGVGTPATSYPGSTVIINETGLGNEAVFSLVLDSEPTDTVFVPIRVGATGLDEVAVTTTGHAAIPTAGIEFTTSNWNTPVPIYVTGVDDMDLDGNPQFAIGIGPTTSTNDTNYGGSGQTDNDIPMQVNDTNTAQVVFSPVPTLSVAGNTRHFQTSEGGAGTPFGMALTSIPTGTITVTITATDTTEGEPSTQTLSWGPTDWNTVKSFTVTGKEDVIEDGTIDYNLTFALDNTQDTRFSSGLFTLLGRNLDNDTGLAEVLITAPQGGLDVFEDGATTKSYSVVLNSEPLNDVTITATMNSGLGYSPAAALVNNAANTNSLVFTAANWSTPQTFEIKAVSDGVNNDFDLDVSNRHRAIGLNFTISSSDAIYNAMSLSGNNATGTAFDWPRTCLTARTLWTSGGGTVLVGQGPLEINPAQDPNPANTVTVYCDETTAANGVTGGWTLLSYSRNTNVANGGVPYPGQSGMTACINPVTCTTNPGIGIAGGPQLDALLRLSTTFGQGQDTVPLPGGVVSAFRTTLGGYNYVGAYVYPQLSTLALSSTPTGCEDLAAGSYFNISNTTAGGTPVFLAQRLRSALAGNDNYAAFSNAYTWSVGQPGSACTITTGAPTSLLGTWQPGQSGPEATNAIGAYSVWVR